MSFSIQCGRIVSFAIWLGASAFAQQNSATSVSSRVTDPGPRAAVSNTGNPLPGLSANQLAAFLDGQLRFQEVEGVIPNGLGPRFNSNSCSSCHAQPAVGGSSPASNPQMAFANSHNQIPPFIRLNGPVREVRFIRKPNGAPDGGVHDLFVITGRSDAPA